MPGYELMGREEAEEVAKVFSESNGVLFALGFDQLRNGRFRVRELEAELAKLHGVKHCLAVTSGTAAQFVALRAMGIGPGDEVITQAFTFVATVEAIQETGATPVVVDVDETLNMCPKSLEAAITPRTKAIIPVHMLGNPARMDEILAIGRKRNIPVLEDACEALGASYKGKRVGSISHCSFFSMDHRKTITTGEGGFILTDDSELHRRMAAYHDHGHINAPGVPRGLDKAMLGGFNFRLTEIQAAVGLAQLRKLETVVSANRANKKRLKDRIREGAGKLVQFRELTDEAGDLADTVMFFLPNESTAQKVLAKMGAANVGTKNVPDAMTWHFAPNWPHLWEKHPVYKGTYATAWAKSAALLNRCVSLPIMVKMTDAEIDRVAGVVVKAVQESA